MVKRLFDIIVSLSALIGLFPILLLAAVGIRLSSPGPIFYLAERVGKDGKIFLMYKFRTMHVNRSHAGSVITAQDDKRVFAFGSWLRKLKIDELPQVLNIVRGEMSIVGPRPEDPHIVRKYYSAVQRRTLDVRPGLASPGSIFNYTHGEKLLVGDDPERLYVEQLLPTKLALELVYIQNASFSYDLQIIWRTMKTIFLMSYQSGNLAQPPEMKAARLYWLNQEV